MSACKSGFNYCWESGIFGVWTPYDQALNFVIPHLNSFNKSKFKAYQVQNPLKKRQICSMYVKIKRFLQDNKHHKQSPIINHKLRSNSYHRPRLVFIQNSR